MIACFKIGTTVYIWSLRYVEEGPAYELWLEGDLDLDTKFDKAVEQLPKALNFYWTMKVSRKCRSISQPK
jgi:hypothetical protein